jgi:Tol biopolymer transport system component
MWKITRLSLLLLCLLVLIASNAFAESLKGKITFWSLNENPVGHSAHSIYIMNPDGTEIVKLMDGDIPAVYTIFVLSPDCRKVAFEVFEWNGNVQVGSHIAIFDIYTNELTNLTNGQLLGCVEPRWSPDGKRLIFHGYKEPGSSYIYIINSDGTDLRQITKGQTPDWSYNGQEIAFVYEKCIYVMNVNDGKMRKIMDEGLAFKYVLSVRWCPDSKKILFVVITPIGAEKPAQTVDIYTVDSDGNNLQLVMKDTFSRSWCWSPDGQKIAIDDTKQNESSDKSRIWIMDSDGKNLQRLTNNDRREALIDWRDPSSVAVQPLKTTQTTWAWIKQGR